MLSQNPKSTVNIDVEDYQTLQKLVLQAKQGDKESFEVLYNTFITPLYRYVLSRTKDVPEAEDICQTTFLQFYQALPRYEMTTSPLAYLFTIAKRRMINQALKMTSVPYENEDLEQEHDDTDIVEETHVAFLAERIDSYLEHLTKDEQEVIRLHYYSELEHKEIAAILEKEEAYIRQIKSRALKKLRALTNHLYE
jgi:RNA polymerase sigma factor (sigma-70 family)